jgi:hypothetical protein
MKAFKTSTKMKVYQDSMPSPKKDQSAAPATKPSMKKMHPSHPVMSGDQSKAPEHKSKVLPMEHAPAGVAGPNGGQSVNMPKSGKVGESEV